MKHSHQKQTKSSPTFIEPDKQEKTINFLVKLGAILLIPAFGAVFTSGGAFWRLGNQDAVISDQNRRISQIEKSFKTVDKKLNKIDGSVETIQKALRIPVKHDSNEPEENALNDAPDDNKTIDEGSQYANIPAEPN